MGAAIPQHKRLAMGMGLGNGMKKGGAVSTERMEKESKSYQKREGVKGEKREMKRGGKC